MGTPIGEGEQMRRNKKQDLESKNAHQVLKQLGKKERLVNQAAIG
jgi:hypothetical protein